MLLDLDAPILTYFELSNAHQAEGVAALFADDALVHDENADHRGRDAIRDWAEATYQKYGVALTPLDARSEGDATVVTADVVGTFPGSPIQLPFRFVTMDGKISELRIG
jgi:ketosteroid isomerase-like protein